MPPLVAAALSVLMIGTAFLSGISGMAGGLILIGVLLALFPVSTAMVLHAVTQMASNGWRTILWWRHVRWSSLIFYVTGCLVAVAIWSVSLLVPCKPMALLLLGLSPFCTRVMPARILPRSGFKLFYFGALIEQTRQIPLWFLAVAGRPSVIGTSMGRLLLDRLSDAQFRLWSNRPITVLAGYYVGYGLVLLTGIA